MSWDDYVAAVTAVTRAATLAESASRKAAADAERRRSAIATRTAAHDAQRETLVASLDAVIDQLLPFTTEATAVPATEEPGSLDAAATLVRRLSDDVDGAVVELASYQRSRSRALARTPTPLPPAPVQAVPRQRSRPVGALVVVLLIVAAVVAVIVYTTI